MKAFFKAIVILALLSMGGAVLWIHFSDKEVVVLADGTIKTVDEIWESGDSIFYEVENEMFLLDQHEIKSYGKRNFGHLILEVKTSVVKGFESFETEINQLFKKDNIFVDLNLAQYVFLLGLPLFITVLFFTRRSAKKRPESVAEVKDSLPRPEKKENGEVSTRIDIVCFFLNLFKQQIGAEPDAPVECVSLSSKNSGPNQIYELRVKHMEDWTKRRMTIGPLGEESGSKSKCYLMARRM